MNSQASFIAHAGRGFGHRFALPLAVALLCCGPNLASAQSTPPLKLASTRLVTNDAPGLAKFYGTVTQVAPVAPFGSGTYFEIRTPGGSVLAISDEASTAKYNASSAVAAQNRTSILEFEVKDVDAERRRLDGVVKTWVMQPYTLGKSDDAFPRSGRKLDQYLRRTS